MVFDIDTLFGGVILLIVIATFLGLLKYLFKGILIISPFIVLLGYFTGLERLYDNQNNLNKYTDNAYVWNKSDVGLYGIDEDYVFISGDLNSAVLTDNEFGIETQAQYLVKKTQQRKEKAYDCGSSDNERTCYRMVWVNQTQDKQFLDQYLLEGVSLDNSVIEAMVEHFPSEDILIKTYPATYEKDGNTLLPAFEGDHLVYMKDPNVKDVGDIRIVFSKINYPNISLLGEIDTFKVKPTFSLDLPLMLMKKASFDQFSDENTVLSDQYMTWLNVLFLFFSYLILVLFYFSFELAKKLLQSKPRKIIYFISPLILACLFNLFFML